MCRASANTEWLEDLGVQIVSGDLSDSESLTRACEDVRTVVHCAAKVGDWGPTSEYRKINVEGTRQLIEAARSAGTLRRWIQISSLGVYSGTDHYGTDETTAPNTSGIDGYTLTKVESEQLVLDHVRRNQLPAVVLRPGFIYGPRDRTVIPKLLERLAAKKFAYLGNHDKLMNNTFVGNLCEAIWLAVESATAVGEVFNIRDPQPVTKQDFINTICKAAELPEPTKVVPLPVAEFLCRIMEGLSLIHI